MATGFVQRWKGKISPQIIFLGSGGVIDRVETAVAATAMAAAGISNIQSGSAATVYPMSAPLSVGARKRISILSVSSGAFVKAPTGYTFDGTNGVFKSTVPAQITLDFVSTARCVISSVFMSSIATLTLSTTT